MTAKIVALKKQENKIKCDCSRLTLDQCKKMNLSIRPNYEINLFFGQVVWLNTKKNFSV